MYTTSTLDKSWSKRDTLREESFPPSGISSLQGRILEAKIASEKQSL
jgi:hypothetical protein